MTQVEIGRGDKLSDGTDVTIISLGPIASEVTKAIEKVREKGISVRHFDAVFLKPFDQKIIDEIVASPTPVITVEDASVRGGLYSAVTEALNRRGFTLPVESVGIPSDRFVEHGMVAELYEECGMNSETIYNKIINQAAK